MNRVASTFQHTLLLASLALLCQFSSSAHARQEGEVVPSPVFPEISYKRLMNDLQIIVASTPHLGEKMTIGLAVRYGSVFDPSGKGGLTHVVSRMFTRATLDRSRKDIQDELAYLGATLDVRHDWDAIHFTLKCRSFQSERALLLLYQVVGEAVFDESDLAELKAELLPGSEQPADPRQRARGNFEAALFQGTSYGRPLQGSRESLQNISIGDVRFFYRRYFSPSAASLVVVGAAAPELVAQKATRIWGVWVRKDDVPFTFLPPRNPPSRTVVLEDEPESAAVQFVLGNLWASRDEPGYLAGIIAARILQERLTQTLPTSLVTVVAEGRRMPGPFYIHGQAAPDQAGSEIRKILEVVEAFKGETVTSQELSEARRKRLGELHKSLADPEFICGLLMDVEVYRLGTNYLPAFSDLLNRVTVDRVQDASKQWIFPAGVLIYVRGPAAALKENLESLGSVQLFP